VRACSKCGEAKPLDKFRRDPKGKQGVAASCKACKTAQDAAYRALNRDRRRAALRAHYAAKRDKGRADRRAYHAANPHIGWSKCYRERARRYGFIPVVEPFTRADVIDHYGDACHYCGAAFEELDHYVAVRDGGPHSLENVRPSCAACNCRKDAVRRRAMAA
jgi:HNH endonuclease